MKKRLNVQFTASQDFEIDVTAEEWVRLSKASNKGQGRINRRSSAWEIIMENVDLEDAICFADDIGVEIY